MKNESQNIQLFFICCTIAISAIMLVWCCRLEYTDTKDKYPNDSIHSVDNTNTHRKVSHPVILPIHNGNSSTPIIIYH